MASNPRSKCIVGSGVLSLRWFFFYGRDEEQTHLQSQGFVLRNLAWRPCHWCGGKLSAGSKQTAHEDSEPAEL